MSKDISTGHICYLCGKMILLTESSVDHIIAQFAGGTSNKANLALTCFGCNNSKDKNIEPRHLGFLFFKNDYHPKDVEDFYQYYIKLGVLSNKPVDHHVLTNALVLYFKTYDSFVFYDPNSSKESCSNFQEIDLEFLNKYNQLPDSLKMDVLASSQTGHSGSNRKSVVKKSIIKYWIQSNKSICCYFCSDTKDLRWGMVIPERFFGKDSVANYSIQCQTCMISENLDFDLTKFRLNYVISSNIFDKELYPKTYTDCLNFFIQHKICNNPALAQSDKSKRKFLDLQTQLKNLFNGNY